MMRHYLLNSPEAAARILVMALVADCDCSPAEMRMLESRLPTEKLGLTPQALSRVIHEFCEDLMLASSREWTGSARLDPRTRAMLLAEITDPLLQAEVLALCEEVVAADGHVADSESAFIETLRAAWTMAQAGLPRSTIHDPAGVL